MASSIAKSTHSPPEIHSISIEKAPDLKIDNTLSPQNGTDANNAKVEPTVPTRQDGKDGFLTADGQRRIPEISYAGGKVVKELKKYARRFDNLSLANLWFYQAELDKFEREIIMMNVEGRVSESAIQMLPTLLKEYRT
jgi:hypothetical protein